MGPMFQRYDIFDFMQKCLKIFQLEDLFPNSQGTQHAQTDPVPKKMSGLVQNLENNFNFLYLSLSLLKNCNEKNL